MMHPIKKYLKENNTYQRDLARVLGISEKHLSRIINEKAGVSLELAVSIQKNTGIPVDALIKKSA